MKPRQIAARAAVLGLAIPLACEAAFYIHPYMAGAWMLWIWPSSIQLMVLQLGPPPYEAAIVIAVSVALNVALYAAIGWLIGFAYSRRRSPKMRTLSP
jgi:hypothetical protein